MCRQAPLINGEVAVRYRTEPYLMIASPLANELASVLPKDIDKIAVKAPSHVVRPRSSP